jgi:hypothetical protein
MKQLQDGIWSAAIHAGVKPEPAATPLPFPEDRCIGTTGEALRIGGMLSFLTTACRADEVIQALA